MLPHPRRGGSQKRGGDARRSGEEGHDAAEQLRRPGKGHAVDEAAAFFVCQRDGRAFRAGLAEGLVVVGVEQFEGGGIGRQTSSTCAASNRSAVRRITSTACPSWRRRSRFAATPRTRYSFRTPVAQRRNRVATVDLTR